MCDRVCVRACMNGYGSLGSYGIEKDKKNQITIVKLKKIWSVNETIVRNLHFVMRFLSFYLHIIR